MTTLKQFQEESRKKFQENHGQYTSLGSLKEAKDFLQQQTTIAYELGKKEMLEMVVEKVDEAKRIGQGINPFPTEAGSALDSLKEKLLTLNEE